MEQQCGNCKFYREMPASLPTHEGQMVGHCHFPPPVVRQGGGNPWPNVRTDDWCGEWLDEDPPPAPVVANEDLIDYEKRQR